VVVVKVVNQSKSNVLSTLRRLITLVEPGADLDQIRDDLKTADNQGNTVVHWAARLGCCRSLRPVLTPEVVSVENRSGVTPLHVAADRGIREEVEVVVVGHSCYSKVYKKMLL